MRDAAVRRRACVVDPFGTGDSAGDFGEATWEIWLDDLLDAARALDGERRVLVGVRSGSLLVADMTPRLDPTPTSVVHVEPERSGRAVVRRWLRTRVARSRLAGDRSESTESLRSRLEGGESLELGGYRLGAELAATLASRALDTDAPPGTAENAHVFAFVDETPDPADAVDTVSNGGGRAGGNRVDGEQVGCDPFEGDRVEPAWFHHRVRATPYWLLEDSEPEPDAVARIAASVSP